MTNIFTLNPQWGDAVVGNLTTGKVEYIKADSFDLASLPSNYETIGAVFIRRGRKVYTVWKNCPDSEALCKRYEMTLTDYTLDGTNRSGILSVRESSSASANVDYTISYNATNMAGLVEQLNAYFLTQTIFTSQNWFARVDGEVIKIGFDYTYWQQASYNTGKSGFALSHTFLPEWGARSSMIAKKGRMNYVPINWDRTIAYFKQDLSSSTYNPTSEIANSYAYPISKYAYLGTSQYRDADYGGTLRAIYGEGEEGWYRYMRAQMVQFPVDRYAGGFHDGKALTDYLAAQTYTLADGVEQNISPAAAKAKSQPTCQTPQSWFLPTIEDLSEGVKPIHYGTTASRDADKLNQTLWRMGGSAISNGTYYWSCVRSARNYAWYFYGYGGFAYYDYVFYNRGRVLSLSLNIL